MNRNFPRTWGRGQVRRLGAGLPSRPGTAAVLKEFSPLVNCPYSKLAGSLNRARRRPLGGKIVRGLASYLLCRRNEYIPTHADLCRRLRLSKTTEWKPAATSALAA